ncbi:hypothetical protein L1049_017544 [Liquidambar formosana]|uniref:SAP domain-containing protein n=1 Tax=Liquidambar formosana TaxID=63359 RepID=A0AAP0X7F5_LIQFO
MGSKEDEDFYLNLSKKELQCLCNKYGLSPNKTKSNLVKSLISYFEKKNLSSISSGERLHGTQEAFLPKSLIPPLEHGAQLNSTRDARKDGYHPREEVRKGNYSQAVKCYKLGSCMGSETYNKAPGSDIFEGFGCSIYNLREASHSHFVFQCDGNNFTYENDPQKLSSDKNNLGFAGAGQGG